MQDEVKTYLMKARCGNCKDSWDVDIPKGIPKNVFERTLKCKNCGCDNIIITTLREW